MMMDPAHGTIGSEEPDTRDLQKNNFADVGGELQPQQETRQIGRAHV